MKVQCSLILIFLLIFAYTVKAQDISILGMTRTITGVVFFSPDEKAIGVQIIDKKSGRKTVTDLDGNFSLQVGDSATLEIIYYGYLPQEITIRENVNSALRIILEEDPDLEFPIVTGFNKIHNKKNNPDSIPIQTERPQISISNVSRSSSSTHVQYVLDNIIVDETYLKLYLSDTSQIKSISILKGPIVEIRRGYPAKGIILIETKQGHKNWKKNKSIRIDKINLKDEQITLSLSNKRISTKLTNMLKKNNYVYSVEKEEKNKETINIENITTFNSAQVLLNEINKISQIGHKKK